MKITIDEVPLSKNKYINMHWAERRRYGGRINWLMMLASSKEKSSNFTKAKLTFDIYFKTNRRRDIQNYLGGGLIAWLDAMVLLEIIKDDNSDCIGQPIVNFHIDKDNPRTEIIIERGE